MSGREKGETKGPDANIQEWSATPSMRGARAASPATAAPDTAELARLANLLVVELLRKV